VCGDQEGAKRLDHELSGNEIIDRRVRFKLTKDPNFGLGFNDLGTVVGVTDFSYHGETKAIVDKMGQLWQLYINGGSQFVGCLSDADT
jgi:hypothetical protein